jgi:hypothetical protein
MAIEIRQLVIRAVVDEGRSSMARPDAGQSVPAARPALREHSDMAPAGLGALAAEERQAIVNACVREVLRKLERARER